VEPGGGRWRTWLPAAALAVLGVAAFAVPAAGAGHGRVFAAAGAVAVLLLAGALAAQRRRQAAADGATAMSEQHAWQAQANAAEQQQRAELWEKRAEQARQEADKLRVQAGEQVNRSRTMMAGLAAAADHLVNVQLPAVLAGSAPLPAFPAGGGGDEEHAALFARVGAAVEESVASIREQADDLRRQSDDQIESSRRAVLDLARVLQASALRIQGQAAKMAEDRPADPVILQASMRVEHAARQMARNAQSVVVLCGEWPGQQWPDPLALPDVVRAAAGRIMSYERVNVSGDHGVAADAGIVEPLIHMVAELLANATQSSPPATKVEVTVQAVQHGAVIEIDDRGIGMEEAEFRAAREILSGSRVVGLGDLGEFPKTGLAVIGHYVDRHGLEVDLRKSPYGGVRAIVHVPDQMVVNNPDPAVGSRSAPAASLPQPDPAGEPEPGETALGHSMPRRVSLRGQAQPASPAGQAPTGTAAVPGETTPEKEGAFIAAYLSAGAAASAPGGGEVQEAEGNTDFTGETER